MPPIEGVSFGLVIQPRRCIGFIRRLQTSVSTAAKAKTAAYAREEGYRIIGELGPATTNNKAPDQQHKYCAHDRSNESRTLIRAVHPMA